MLGSVLTVGQRQKLPHNDAFRAVLGAVKHITATQSAPSQHGSQVTKHFVKESFQGSQMFGISVVFYV